MRRITKLSVRQLGAAFALAALVACGGGGGGGETPATNPRDVGASVSNSSLAIERDLQQREAGAPLVVSLLVARPPESVYYYRYNNTSSAISHVGSTVRAGNDGVDFQILLTPQLPRGSYSDTVTIEVCLDETCQQPVVGSPFTVTVSLAVGYFAPTEPGIAALALPSSVVLAHDLVDAAYSATLDAVISVSRTPAPALNIHDLTTGATRSVALATPPTALSLAPDGLQAAIGHDAAVSVVDLASGPTVTARHAVSLRIGELVFDGRGRVHLFGSEEFNHNPIHRLDLASGAELRSVDLAYGVVHAVLHPSGDRLYYANRNLSPDDLFVIGLRDATPAAVIDSRYHGEHPICGRVWPSPDGTRLYTACGNSFQASPVVDQDMLYAGALALSTTEPLPWAGYEAVSLAVSSTNDRITLLERPRLACDPRNERMIECYTHLNVYDVATLALLSRHSLAPITVGADRFAQTGRFVFQRSNGRAVLLSELRDSPNPAAGVRLSLLP